MQQIDAYIYNKTSSSTLLFNLIYISLPYRENDFSYFHIDIGMDNTWWQALCSSLVELVTAW